MKYAVIKEREKILLKICQYIPHGAIPDKRGFAPSIVAENISKYFQTLEPFFISNQEDYDKNYEQTDMGEVYRIKEGKIYMRLFKKITRLDLYHIYIRVAKILDKVKFNYFCTHQLEFPVYELKQKLCKNLKILIYAHTSGRSFKKEMGTPSKYIVVSEFTKNFLIQTIERINNLKKYKFVKENDRNTIVSKFDWKISAEKLEDICLS